MRRLIRFGNWDIPIGNRENEYDFDLRNTYLTMHNVHGSFDYYGNELAPREMGKVSARFMLYEDEGEDVEDQKRAMLVAYLGGKQKLYTALTPYNTERRFTYAKMSKKPKMDSDWSNKFHLPVICNWDCTEPFWYDENTGKMITDFGFTAVNLTDTGEPIEDYWFAEQTISASPTSFTIVNNGDEKTQRILIRLIPQGAGGCNAPTLLNVTNSKSISITTNLTDYISINAFLSRVRSSADTGTTWDNAFAITTIPEGQAVLMELEPGNNNFTYTSSGTPNVKIQIWWYHAYSW